MGKRGCDARRRLARGVATRKRARNRTVGNRPTRRRRSSHPTRPAAPHGRKSVARLTCGPMKIREIMTPDVQCVKPGDSLVEAASLMRQLDVGVLPVCEHDKLVGMLTDRDIAVRAVADGRDPNHTKVRDTMSPGIIYYVLEDQDVEDAIHVMEQHQIRRAPVMNRDEKLVGIVSMADIAVETSTALCGEALKEVSQPAQPNR